MPLPPKSGAFIDIPRAAGVAPTPPGRPTSMTGPASLSLGGYGGLSVPLAMGAIVSGFTIFGGASLAPYRALTGAAAPVTFTPSATLAMRQGMAGPSLLSVTATGSLTVGTVTVPDPGAGNALLVDAAGNYLTDASGNYLYGKA